MARLMDILLGLVNALCGGAADREEPPTEQQTSEVQRPPLQRPPPQQPPLQRPSLQRPSLQRPSLQQPPLQRPSLQQPPLQRPSFQRPSLQQPPFQRPPLQRPSPQRPSLQQSPLQPPPTTRPEHTQIPPEHHRPKEQEPKPRPEHRPRQDQSQINRHDEHYTALRAKAVEHGDLMARCFQESHEAYGRGDRARAKELSVQGKQYERTMESLNAEASAWIFRQNNLDSNPREIDLHGLYVKEAVSFVDKATQEARQRGDADIRFIVGKGLHSVDRVAKIKPAIEDLMKKQGIPTEADPHNAGVLIARLR